MSKQLGGLFEVLEDETPSSPEKQIGEAIAGALTSALKSVEQTQAKSAEQMAEVVESALTKMAEAMPKPVPVVDLPATVEAKPVLEWVFDIERDENGWLTRIIATANEVD